MFSIGDISYSYLFFTNIFWKHSASSFICLCVLHSNILLYDPRSLPSDLVSLRTLKYGQLLSSFRRKSTSLFPDPFLSPSISILLPFNSVNIVDKLQAGWPKSGGLLPLKQQRYLSSPSAETGSEVRVIGVFFPLEERLGYEPEVNAWSYTSTVAYIFMAWCLFKHRDQLIQHCTQIEFVLDRKFGLCLGVAGWIGTGHFRLSRSLLGVILGVRL